jgi:rare lipoprotein A
MSPVRICLILLTGLALLFGGFSLAERRTAAPRMHLVQSGMASWYGQEQGERTASGETFDRHDFTAASRHLPFNTMVRVTNEANGRSVDVRINDRGPFEKGRVLDVSEAAADSLDMKQSGVARVKIEVVDSRFNDTVTSP